MKHKDSEDSETLVYIEKMLAELEKIARKSGNALLSYLIRMASQEARERIDEKRQHR